MLNFAGFVDSLIKALELYLRVSIEMLLDVRGTRKMRTARTIDPLVRAELHILIFQSTNTMPLIEAD